MTALLLLVGTLAIADDAIVGDSGAASVVSVVAENDPFGEVSGVQLSDEELETVEGEGFWGTDCWRRSIWCRCNDSCCPDACRSRTRRDQLSRGHER